MAKHSFTLYQHTQNHRMYRREEVCIDGKVHVFTQFVDMLGWTPQAWGEVCACDGITCKTYYNGRDREPVDPDCVQHIELAKIPGYLQEFVPEPK